ncbi:hypothetical protein [Solimonas flava]|uniref:hypothetical protein n=1 Tax=Solimonas flava TaxID=415849 RepID=UPI00041B1DFF|nr:hypothetical protein [Solimonas flava]
MKALNFVLAALALAGSAAATAEVGVSVTVGEPGFYGRIDLGDMPQPRLIYPQPVIVRGAPSGAPVYLHVPPGHAKHWSQHCAEYGACGQHVYFVDDDWYEKVYVPSYQKQHGHGADHGNGHGPEHKPDRGHGNGPRH